MRIKCTLLALLLGSRIVHGQATIGRQQVDQFKSDQWGDKSYALTWLPTDYNSSGSTQYPLIIFLHGVGEGGSSVNDLNKLITQSPPALPERIANGWNATAKNPLDGKTYEFIVISPQTSNGWSFNYDQLKYIVPDILSRYRVDLSRVYITGLSAGGDGVWTVMGSADVAFTSQFAAFVTVNTAGVDAANGLTDLQIKANVDAGIEVKDGINAWTITTQNDGLNITSFEYMDGFNRAHPAKPGKFTDISQIGHSGWGQAYDPNWRPSVNYYGTNSMDAPFWPNGNNGSPVTGSGVTQDSLNIYEWMLLSRKGGTPAVQQPPPPPVQPVAPPPPPIGNAKAIPGKIEAENYDNMFGVQTQGTSDDAGLNVGWIDNGDWMDYVVNAASAGSYNVSFRVATPEEGSALQLRASDGTVLTTVDLPNTGDFQAWQTVTASVNLPAGVQTLRLISVSDANWNINWMQFDGPVGSKSGGGTDNGNGNGNGNSSGPAKYIKVNLYGGDNPYNNNEWNNWNVNGSAESDYLNYSDGTPSSVSAVLTYNESLADNSDGYGEGMAPAEVLRYTSYSDADRKLYIVGLNPSATYSLELYASRGLNPGNSTAFSAGGETAAVGTFDNLNHPADLNNLQANAQGQIVVSINALNSYNYINGFVLTEFGQGNAAAAVVPGVASEAAGAVFGTADKPVTGISLQVYPNPIQDHFLIEVNTPHTGRMNVQVVDASGSVRRSYLFNKDRISGQFDLYAHGLAAGAYFVRVQIGDWVSSQKLIKL
ncbi:MAG: carbohydrate-binding protein [Bacteroidota bacterium]|nr:carbohydrate-binding protein [Bacteroidota bacterium]